MKHKTLCHFLPSVPSKFQTQLTINIAQSLLYSKMDSYYSYLEIDLAYVWCICGKISSWNYEYKNSLTLILLWSYYTKIHVTVLNEKACFLYKIEKTFVLNLDLSTNTLFRFHFADEHSLQQKYDTDVYIIHTDEKSIVYLKLY